MSWDEDFDESKLHEDCVSRGEVFAYVMENDFDDVREAVAEADAQDWLADRADTLELINIVSSYDREQLRAAIRDLLNVDPRVDRDVSTDEFFAVAADVAKFLERTRSPYAETYGITESVEWAGELIEIARLFREILFARSEQHQAASATAKVGAQTAEQSKLSKLDRLTHALSQRHNADLIARALRGPHDRLNEILQNGVVYRLRQEGRRSPRTVREVDAEKTPLRVFLAFWMSTYLSLHEQHVDLAVCVECGKIFARERRDNVYCSKTCQNRVAYKRKKIFVAGVLREVNVKDSPGPPSRFSGLELDPETPPKRSELRRGLCLNHPRFGLGVVESVQHLRRRLRLKYEDSVVIKDIPDDKSAQEFFDELKARGELSVTVARPRDLTSESLQDAAVELRTPVDWTEMVDPSGPQMLAVRFLSGVRRFSRWETKDLTFYAVENPRLLAELL